jgi:hypothetical protein
MTRPRTTKGVLKKVADLLNDRKIKWVKHEFGNAIVQSDGSYRGCACLAGYVRLAVLGAAAPDDAPDLSHAESDLITDAMHEIGLDKLAFACGGPVYFNDDHNTRKIDVKKVVERTIERLSA